jgi:hypothetical protein
MRIPSPAMLSVERGVSSSTQKLSNSFCENMRLGILTDCVEVSTVLSTLLILPTERGANFSNAA